MRIGGGVYAGEESESEVCVIFCATGVHVCAMLLLKTMGVGSIRVVEVVSAVDDVFEISRSSVNGERGESGACTGAVLLPLRV